MRTWRSTILIWLTLLPASFPASSQNVKPAGSDTVLHVRCVEEVRFRVRHFEIVGNLYIPAGEVTPVPAVIWVHGSGPSVRGIARAETRRLVNCFLDRRIAYFRMDKPGSGESTGSLNPDSLFDQLSGIVVAAVRTLRGHPLVGGRPIGLFGSSQAGYIMPMAIARCPDIAFMIGSSCPGENSVRQWEYLLRQQLLCQGLPAEDAERHICNFTILRSTEDRAAFDRAVEYFEKHPMIVPSLGYDSGFAAAARAWWPREARAYDESLFDPTTLVPKMSVPVFLVYGERDTQIDPRQAMEAYRKACQQIGKTDIRIELLTESDHNMCVSGGCLDEITRLNNAGVYRFDPAYLNIVASWVDDLRVLFTGRR